MNTRKLAIGKLATLTIMATVLCVMLLYAASTIPALAVVCLLLASFCVCVPSSEQAYGFALLLYAVASGVSYYILSAKWLFALYTVFLGHYGVFRALLHNRVDNRVFRVLLKLLYANAFLCAGVYLAAVLFIPIVLPAFLPVWGWVALLQAALIVYDIVYGLVTIVYANRIREYLMPQR